MNEVWMISNRQRWPEALLRGLITSKTRSLGVYLPPVGAVVYLHASKALWHGWRNLWWIEGQNMDVPNLPRGGVVGVATVVAKGLTEEMMPRQDRKYFSFLNVFGWGNCAGPQTVVFGDVKRMPFIPCRGAQVPTRKLPAELRAWHSKNWGDERHR